MITIDARYPCTIPKFGAETLVLLSQIQKNGPLTKADLASRTGYQMSTLNRHLEPLLTDGWIAPCGTADSCGGRRPTLFDVCPQRVYCIGVNIATVFCEVMVTDLKMRALACERFETPPGALPEDAINWVADCIARFLDRLDIRRESVLGAGLSTIGPFDREHGKILPPLVLHLDPHWIGYPIRSGLEEACGFPVAADIGANNGALVEYLFGNGRGYKKVLCVRCGMSIKTSYIVSGSIVRTSNNAEDAFGHMSVDIDGLPCVCGNYGCIECYSAVPALVKRFCAEVKKGRTTSLAKPMDTITYLDVLGAAESGDALAREIVLQAATVLGSGLANYLNLINPDLVTFDSLIIRNSDLYYNTVVEVAHRKSRLLNRNSTTRFLRNSQPEDLSTQGAAVLALETFLFRGANFE